MSDVANPESPEPSSAGLSDADLLRRAVVNATGPGLHRRYIHVCAILVCGSTYARALCRRFGVDPDESIGDDWPADDRDYDEVELAPDDSADTEDP